MKQFSMKHDVKFKMYQTNHFEFLKSSVSFQKFEFDLNNYLSNYFISFIIVYKILSIVR